MGRCGVWGSLEMKRKRASPVKGPGEVVLGIKDAYWAVGKAATPEPESCNQVQVGGGRQILFQLLFNRAYQHKTHLDADVNKAFRRIIPQKPITEIDFAGRGVRRKKSDFL